MSKNIAQRGLALLFAAGAVASGLALTAGPANAESAAECRITGQTPGEKVAVGPDGKELTFQVETDCAAGSKISWRFAAQYPKNVPNNATIPLYRFATWNLSQHATSPGNKFTLRGDTSAGNLLAGQPMQAQFWAFVDTGAVGQQDEPYLEGGLTTLTQVRATQIIEFATSTGTTVSPGTYVKFSGKTQRADWESKSWKTFDSHGRILQFKADGASQWTTVATDNLAHSAQASGDYRLGYAGDDWSGASYSERSTSP